MKNKLKALFDYQKFERNKELDEVIHSVLNTQEIELEDERLLAVTGGKREFNDLDIGNITGKIEDKNK